MAQRLTGLNPLAYTGVEARTPPNTYLSPTSPTTSDAKNVYLGDMWINTTTQHIYVLTSVAGGIANWMVIIGGGGAAVNFNTDAGMATESGGTVNIFGDGVAINTVGSGNTITISMDTNVTLTNLTVTGNFDSLGTAAITKLELQSNPNGILVTDNAGNVTATNGTNGQLLIGGGTAPAWGNITSTGGSLTITNGANTINIEAPTATGTTTFHTNSGTATQAAGAITIDGDGNTITTTGSGSTVTAALTNGTNGQLLIGGGSHASWANLTSTGATVTITNGANSINLEATGGGSSGASTFITDSGNALESLGDITFAGGHNISTSGAGQTVTLNLSGTTNHALQVGNSTGSLTSLGVATNGQIPIGSTGSSPVLATITAGSGVNIVNGAGSITISAPGGGGGGGTIVTTFETPGSFTFEKNASTKYIEVWGWCGGGGGGAGQSGGTNPQGGAGGGSGSFFRFKAPAMFFGASEPVVVGAGGTGGAPVVTAQGNNGTEGEVSSFGNIQIPLVVNNVVANATASDLMQAGAGGGNVLQTSPGCGYSGGVFADDASFVLNVGGSNFQYGVPTVNITPGTFGSKQHGGGAGSFAVGQNGLSVGGISPYGLPSRGSFAFLYMLGTSGAQGGSISTGSVQNNGGSGGNVYKFDTTSLLSLGGLPGIISGPVDGGNGSDMPTDGGLVWGGTGGGGGASNTTAPGKGGNGGFPGGGGGGGGASGTGRASGAGGNGGNGMVIVIEYT